MKKAFWRSEIPQRGRSEAGVTMILVAVCMVGIIAMAALSIDVVTLYLARMEAQRTADAAALAAARVISISGITGDPTNASGYWAQICGGNSSLASQAALAAAAQTVDNAVPSSTTVTYSGGGSSDANCANLVSGTSAFGVNPMVTVSVTRNNLPTFFSHMWGNTGNTTTANATAEVFNPSNSGNVGNGGATGVITPVWPRCVKPWLVPNLDPMNPAPGSTDPCTTGANRCQNFVDLNDGHIIHSGISLGGGSSSGVIGEQFWLAADCHHFGGSCTLRTAPQPNYTHPPSIPTGYIHDLLYVPGQTLNTSVSVPSGATNSPYEEAIAGCDETTVYQCGSLNSSLTSPNLVDLGENPVSSGDTTNGVQALIHQGAPGNSIDGQDYINDTSYPFQLQAGTSNPMLSASLATGSTITSSSSIVTVPIYDSTNSIANFGTSPVTIVGFLQVFINYVDSNGNVNVTVLNVAGCGNGQSASPGNPVYGSSPVPVRLISQ